MIKFFSKKEGDNSHKTYQRNNIIAKNEICYDNSGEIGGGIMNNKLVGKFIAQTRRKRSLTQAQLGEILGISDKAISKWERGLSAPDIAILPKLSKALDVSIAEILLGTEINTTITKEEANNITLSGIGLYKQIFKKKYTKIIGILIGIILIITISFSTIYLFSNFDKCQVYRLHNGSSAISFQGLLVKNQKENSILLTKFKYQDENKNEENEPIINNIDIELTINNSTLYKDSKEINNVLISEELPKINILINESKVLSEYTLDKLQMQKAILKLKCRTTENTVLEYSIPIKIQKRFSNNRLVY